MATVSIPGFKASLSLATSSSGGTVQKFGELIDVTLTVAGSALDASSKDSGGWKEHIPGMREWSGSGNALYLLESSDVGQLAYWNTLNGQVPMWVNLREATNSTTTWLGMAVVTGFDVESPLDGAAKVKFGFKGTNTLTKSAATS